jgi:hypothetical protein
LKRKYPKEGLHGLSLVAVACFLIDEGCDWTAIDKRGCTAAAVRTAGLRIWEHIADIFKVECKRHHMMAAIKFTPNAQIKDVNMWDGSTLHDLDLDGHPRIQLQDLLEGNQIHLDVQTGVYELIF